MSEIPIPCLVILHHLDINPVRAANNENLIQEDTAGPLDREKLNTSGELFKQNSMYKLSEDLGSNDSFDGVEFHLYLFANPRSGSQKAKRYVDLGF
jgi:hypothetical protein